MKKPVKLLLCGCLLVIAIFVLPIVGFLLFQAWQYHLPDEAVVHEQFKNHRADFIQLAALLRKDPAVQFIDHNGVVGSNGFHGRTVLEYRDLIHKIGIKNVLVRGDGSMEFTLWGNGGPIMSDSYMGVRYYPADHKSSAGWMQTLVASLDSEKLPQENGAVASGLYVVPIEPEWYVYRFEYQE